VNKNFFEGAKAVVRQPEFRVVWVAIALIVVAFCVAFLYLPTGILGTVGILMAASAAIMFIGVYRFTERDRKAAIGKNELKSIVANLKDAIIFYDKDFKALFFNPAAERLFDVSAADVTGHEFQPQDVEKEGWRTLAQAMFPSLAPTVVSRSSAGEYPQVLDLSFADPTMELRVSTLPVADAQGVTIGFMKVIQNRTREAMLLKSKNEFLTVASHQLRTPVTDIVWAIESLAGDSSLSVESKKTVESALEASHGLVDIIEDLLNVAKIEEGRFGYSFESEDIVGFVGSILERLAPLAKRVGVRVRFEKPAGPLPKPLIDKQKLSLALGNLVENAVRYNSNDGEVLVRVEKIFDRPFIEISVKDTGIGLSQEEIGNLFRKFYRAPGAVKVYTGGSGLGLYITKNIIQAHGGEITVESEPSRGSTFRFTLPTEPKLMPQHEVAVEE